MILVRQSVVAPTSGSAPGRWMGYLDKAQGRYCVIWLSYSGYQMHHSLRGCACSPPTTADKHVL